MQSTARPKDLRTAQVLIALVAGMVGLAYASVPLYRMFCQVTGYGGTTQQASTAPGTVLARTMTVRFDANTAPGLPWRFRPAESQTLKIGEIGLAKFTAANLSGHRITGTATFNVTPDSAGPYFSKIDCFCFTEQTLEPGEAVEMPVTFFVDPSIADDPELAKLKSVTLSYTFFPQDEQDDHQS